MTLNLVNAVLAEPFGQPITAIKEYVVAGNGLFVRAEDSRIEALIPVAECTLPGLDNVIPYARLKERRVPEAWLRAILKSARAHMPNEAMYQIYYEAQGTPGWLARMPTQMTDGISITYEDDGSTVIDLHSHNSMPAFFSDTDNKDEQGFRLYCVIGKIDTDAPEIACRVGVYGHHWPVPVETIFESAGPFVDTYETHPR